MLIGCNEKRQSHHPELISEKLYIPESLTPFNDYAKNLKINSSKFYMITLLDADCYICVGELKEWTNFLKKNPEFSEHNTLFVAVGKYNFYFEKSLLEKNFIKVPVFLDIDSTFIKRNSLFGLKQKDTIILDSNLVVRYVGSPIANKNNKDKIFNLIDN